MYQALMVAHLPDDPLAVKMKCFVGAYSCLFITRAAAFQGKINNSMK